MANARQHVVDFVLMKQFLYAAEDETRHILHQPRHLLVEYLPEVNLLLLYLFLFFRSHNNDFEL